jgi:hypothetical protein
MTKMQVRLFVLCSTALMLPVVSPPTVVLAQAVPKGPAKKTVPAKGAPAGKAAPAATKPIETKKPAGAKPVETKGAEPATPEQAAKVIDLRTFPLMPGGKVGGIHTLGILMYEAPGTPKAAFEFQKRELLKRGFQEQPGGYFSDDTNTALFTKAGFRVSASSGSGREKGNASVTLVNDGNVDLAKLPVPPGVKPFHPRPTEASYTTTAKVADTAEACRKLLLAAGWQPYGRSSTESNDGSIMHYFKQNGIQLHLWVMTTPAEGGKTLIRYSTDLLQVDLPAPPEMVTVADYTDSQKTLRFDAPKETTDSIVAFYQERLPKLGWKATTDHPIRDDNKKTQFLIFRNGAKELLSLDMAEFSDIVRVELSHQTPAELAEEERLAKIAAEKARMEEEQRNKKFKVVVPVPANAKELDKVSERTIEFQLATGSGPAAIKAFRDHYVKEGWKEKEGAELGKNTGQIELVKDELELELSYFDTGITDADIRVSGSFKVVLETATSKDKVAGEKPAADKPKAKKPAIPGLPDLPPGVELPADVKAELEKALKELGGKKP